MMKGMCGVHKLAWLLVIIGCLNWGLVGFFQWNLVHALLANWAMVERVVYGLVGLSGLAILFAGACKKCTMCSSKKM